MGSDNGLYPPFSATIQTASHLQSLEGNWTRWGLLCYCCRLDGWLDFAAQECRLCGQETAIDRSLKSTFREDECMEVSQLVTDSVWDLVPSPRLEASRPNACFARMLPVAPLGTRLCFMRRELSLGFVRYLPTGLGWVFEEDTWGYICGGLQLLARPGWRVILLFNEWIAHRNQKLWMDRTPPQITRILSPLWALTPFDSVLAGVFHLQYQDSQPGLKVRLLQGPHTFTNQWTDETATSLSLLPLTASHVEDLLYICKI